MNHPESNPVHTFLDSARERMPDRSAAGNLVRWVPTDPAAPLGIGVQHLPNGDLDTRARALAVPGWDAGPGRRSGPHPVRARAGLHHRVLRVPLRRGRRRCPASTVGATAHRLGRIEAVSRDCAASRDDRRRRHRRGDGRPRRLRCRGAAPIQRRGDRHRRRIVLATPPDRRRRPRLPAVLLGVHRNPEGCHGHAPEPAGPRPPW